MSEPSQATSRRRTQQDDVEQTVIAILKRLAQELHPNAFIPGPVTLDVRLEEDVGLDSLARVEFLQRVERAFKVKLPEHVLGTAETARDVLTALMTVRTAPPTTANAAPMNVDEPVASPPMSVATLPGALEWRVETHPDRTHIVFEDSGGSPHPVTYAVLWRKAKTIAAALQQRGVEPGQSVAIMLPTGVAYFHSFFGVMLAGAVPVPIYPPARLTQIEDHFRRHSGILSNAQAVLLVTMSEAKALAQLLSAQVETLRHVVTPRELLSFQGRATSYVAKSEDLAFLQYTSGSTGNPKGVMLSHANLLSSLRAMGQAIRVSGADVFVSWLPLYHDMGLIGAWLGSLYYAYPLVVMSPLSFLARPERWLWAIHSHRGTISGGPNFAFDLCVRKIQDEDIVGLDLSSWRWAFNGAEPVSPETMRAFTERFRAYGFRPEAVSPVYGLAENALGVTFPPIGQGLFVDRVERDVFMRTRRAEPVTEDDAPSLSFVSCGRPLPRHEVRIVDSAGREVGEREEGRLEFKGPSATRGYYRRPDETAKLFHGEWLDSGDLAYIAAGDVYLTGRVKDVVIRSGRNIYPYDLEAAVGDIAGVRRGCVAVFGGGDPLAGTERLIVLAETRETDPDRRNRLRAQINAVTIDLLGEPADDIVLAPVHSVLKTSSGKIRRSAVRERYERGLQEVAPRAAWRQVMRLAASDIEPVLRRVINTVAERAYAAYVWILFALLAPLAWVMVAVTPRPDWAWRASGFIARVFFRLAGAPVTVVGKENLPESASCILVANHASYLDGLVLVAALPRPFSFVAKRELAGQFFAGTFLRRLGAQFVERFDAEQGREAADRLIELARSGRSLVFFPEGTFTRAPGLRPFHLGAFAAAAQAGLAVTPVTLRGLRSILRGDTWFPRRGVIRVVISQSLTPTGQDWNAAIQLRDAVRKEILAQCGEPDLVG
ncbi:MAG TPA: AMP-binding protein [Burkholderiales bacterium]|nr:AMP-binding protein [Burkholderiales bacterium]